MLFILLFILSIVLVPSYALAWGPLTHVYLGSEVFYVGSLLPVAAYNLIRKYRQDYLYGNLMADMVLAKKYLPKKSNTHTWDVALRLYESAETQPEKAFALGYMSHLAADTVAHGSLTTGSRNLAHALLELRADSLLDRSYWFQAVAIEGKVQKRNDLFLERSLASVIFSFKTNRRIFKSALALSYLNKSRFPEFISPKRKHLLDGLREESLDRIVDVLTHGSRSEVLKEDPIGGVRRNKILSALLG